MLSDSDEMPHWLTNVKTYKRTDEASIKACLTARRIIYFVIKPEVCLIKHLSAEVVTICMLLLQSVMSSINLLYVGGSSPPSGNTGIAQQVRATAFMWVRVPLPTLSE